MDRMGIRYKIGSLQMGNLASGFSTAGAWQRPGHKGQHTTGSPNKLSKILNGIPVRLANYTTPDYKESAPIGIDAWVRIGFEF